MIATLDDTRSALDTAREKRQEVEHALSGANYAKRAAAREELRDLDQQIERLAAELPALEAAHERQQRIERLQTLAADGAHALAAVEQARAAFDQAIAPILESYSQAFTAHLAARRAFYAELGKDIDPAEINADVRGVLIRLDDREMRHDRPYDAASRFPGARNIALREEYIRRTGGRSIPMGVEIFVLPKRSETE